MENRLQFVHCDTLFKTSSEAKNYVVSGDLISYTRPALYAEPMVLKYGDETNPNILLAIGSVGNGETHSKSNQVFFIDFADLEKSVHDIEDSIENGNINTTEIKKILTQVIASCGFNEDGEYIPIQDDEYVKNATSLTEADKLLSNVVRQHYDELKKELQYLNNFTVDETSTIKHTLTNNNDHLTLTSDVKIAPFKTINQCNIENILIKEDNGLFVNVNLQYDEDSNKLLFDVNGVRKEYSLPVENHVINGYYDTATESLILEFKEPLNDTSKTLSIDLSKLIGEWKVMGEYSDTPIVLTKEPVKYDDKLRGAADYQDILKGDIRIAESDYKPYNILKKTENGKALYVDGIADNIKYLKNGKVITVKQALDEVDCNVSTYDNNIIYRKEDGIYANVELEYITSKNALKFTKTTKDGSLQSQELVLNNISFLEDIRYDNITEEIVISYKDATGEIKQIRIPVSSLFDEWDVDNTNHTVTLYKTDHQTSGQDKLSADVNISHAENNILEIVNHSLYVKGTADNIIYHETNVQSALDLINGGSDIEGSVKNLIKKEAEERTKSDQQLQANIEAEQVRATEAENKLQTSIQDTNTALNNEVNRAKLAEAENKAAIDSEILRATSAENQIDEKLTTALEKQSTVNNQIVSSITSLTQEVETKTSELNDKLIQQEKDLTCTTESTESITLTKTSNAPSNGYKLSGKVNISTADNNIIQPNGALYASVDINYNSATNTLTLLTSNHQPKDIILNVGSIIQSIIYDAEQKALVITYVDEDGVTQKVTVPVSDLYNEWVVEDRDSSVIKLTKVKGEKGQPDILKADLKLATPESGNLLQNTDGNLYASNKALDIKLSDHVGTNVETAIVNLNKRLETVETVIDNKAVIDVVDSPSIDLTLTPTEANPMLSANVNISKEEGNIIEVKDDGLYAAGTYDFGTY